MSRIWSGFLLVAIAAGAPAQDKKEKEYKDEKGRGKNAEVYKAFMKCMEANQAEYRAIGKDIEDNKPEADIKKRLKTIREICAKAKTIQYRKNEEESEQLERHFEIFDLKLTREFEEQAWDTKENRLHLHERLKAKCDVCHEPLRD